MKNYKVVVKLNVKSDPNDEVLFMEDILEKIQEDIDDGTLDFSYDKEDLDEDEEDVF